MQYFVMTSCDQKPRANRCMYMAHVCCMYVVAQPHTYSLGRFGCSDCVGFVGMFVV